MHFCPVSQTEREAVERKHRCSKYGRVVGVSEPDWAMGYSEERIRFHKSQGRRRPRYTHAMHFIGVQND
jgi:hypothetical protein